MENKKIYGFFGSPTYDFIIYLSSILVNLGNHVLVVDLSKKQEVMSCYIQSEEHLEFIQYKYVDYTSAKEFGVVDTHDYEYILLYQDEPSNEVIHYDGICVIADYKKESLLKMEDYIDICKDNVHLILRDFCSNKLVKQYILKEFITFDAKLLDFNVIELDYYDYAYRISMTHEYYQEFRHISKDYKECLLKTIDWMANPPRKTLNRAYRLAERGKCIGNSILE